MSTDPEFTAKAADVVGLYLHPPENAVVLCVDEKPSIQALERAQGYLRRPNGQAMSGASHRYQRHGTTTLFAALEVATGRIQAGHATRRRRREFLDFMNELVREYSPEQALHVILDNLNTHKPKRDRWRARHPNVHFHYTPTNACWLNQIEIWFSILSRRALRGASFTSPRQLRQAIDAFIAAYNSTAQPFEWRSFSTSRLSPAINRFCVVSQSTLSWGQGRSVPVEGVSASWRALRLPCQVRPYFSSMSVMVQSPTSALRTSTSTDSPRGPSVTSPGKRDLSRSMFSVTKSGERVSLACAVSFFNALSVGSVVRNYLGVPLSASVLPGAAAA